MRLKIKKTPLRVIFLWLIALIFEYPFIFSFFNYQTRYLQTNFQSVMAIHIMAAIVMFFSFPKEKGWFHHQRNWAQVFFFIVLFLPFFGIFITIILYIGYKRNPDPEKLFEEDVSFYKEDLPSHKDQNISLEKQVSQAINILPLADVLTGNDINLKRGAIEKLAVLETPEAIKTLLQHNSDSSPEVRFFITSALTKIKKSIDESLQAIKHESEKNPKDLSVRLSLAKIYIRYANSGLLDESGTNASLQEAVYHLKYAVNKNYSSEEAFRLLIKIYKKQNDWEGVFKISKKLENAGVTSVSEIIQIRLVYYYTTKNYTDFISELKNLIKLDGIDSEWVAMANWWGVYKSELHSVSTQTKLMPEGCK